MARYGISDRSMILIVAIASMLVTASVAYSDWTMVVMVMVMVMVGSTTLLTAHGDPEMTLATKMNPTRSLLVDQTTGVMASITVPGLPRTHLFTSMMLLVMFKYDPPSQPLFHHSVYLLPNMCSYMACDLSRAKLIANTTQGDGEGFKFVLKRWQPYYFVCG
ncbi:hypothetical protein LWI28_004301 [Acer negundo]|uniref:Uncharacterized protein n=1 Tax=Acer negundo TaxID=4023 RepID=A0AAD5IYF8_ACENE|nr:hypothetical protein LWI28_004301 [Acer negundo]